MTVFMTLRLEYIYVTRVRPVLTIERVRIEYPAVTMIAPHCYNGGNPIISKKLVPHHPAAAAAGCKEMKMYTRPIIP